MQSIDALEDKEKLSHNSVFIDFSLRTTEA